MARKKKETNKEYKWSDLQKNVFKFIESGTGHLVIEANAGCAKTTTMVKCLDYIPEDKSILLAAFNRDIVKELEKRTKNYHNVQVKTLHGLGLAMLRRNFPKNQLVPDVYKYDTHIKNHINIYTSINIKMLKNGEYQKYLDNIKKYVEFGRFYMCQTEKDLDFIEERYSIGTIADEKEIAVKVMGWGKTELDTIDYTDMVWLPHVLYLKPYGLQFDFIFIDECQDMNVAERELVLKCFKMGTRMISVGDENQCLYSFAGSSPDSFKVLKSMPNTTCLPLSISYRCPKNIVKLANKYVPQIEANPDNEIEGEIKYNVQLDEVNEGDMVLCRNNAPLVHAYNEFLKNGRKATIRGKEFGSTLKTIIKGYKVDELSQGLNKDGLFTRLYDNLFNTRDKLMTKHGIDKDIAMKSPIIENKLDIIKTLEVLSEGLTTKEELIEKVEEVFPKKSKDEGISLSTIHKAKGLEANNVFIICPSLMPSKSAKQEWEITQEKNLIYVAYTRAKNKLAFVDENGFESFFNDNAGKTEKILDRIEEKVNLTLGKTKKAIINESTARTIIHNATTIRLPQPKTRIIDISNKKEEKTFSNIGMKKKITKRKR